MHFTHGFRRAQKLLCASVLLAAGWIDTAAADTFGLDIITGNSATTNINNTTIRRAQRFDAPKDITVDRLHFQYNANTGTSTQIFALQADSGGNPSGVDIATATITTTSGVTGYNATFDSPVALVSGQRYYIVNRSTDANSTNFPAWRVLGPGGVPSQVNTYGPIGIPATGNATNLSQNSGSTWSGAATGQTSLWGLSNSITGEFFGQPYSTTQVKPFGGNASGNGNRIWIGQRFKYLGQSGDLQSLQLQARGLGGTLTDDVRLHIVTVASQGLDQPTPSDPLVQTVVPGTELGSSVLFASGTAPATSPGVFQTANFASPIHLDQDASYLLLLETASAGVMQLSFNQGSDAGIGAAFANGNFGGLTDAFVLSNTNPLGDQAQPLGANGVPLKLFSSDLFSSGVNTYRDARFLLNVVVPEPGCGGLLALTSAILLRRRRGA
jgi:hypothetical protein